MTEKMLIVLQSHYGIYIQTIYTCKKLLLQTYVYCYLIRMKQFNAYQA